MSRGRLTKGDIIEREKRFENIRSQRMMKKQKSRRQQMVEAALRGHQAAIIPQQRRDKDVG
jgi:hypothetical protein